MSALTWEDRDMTTFEKDTLVRFTVGPLGLVAHVDATRFADTVALAGTEGIYIGPHPALADWHFVAVGAFVCLCAESQFEVVGS